jgi:hypothetical protein
MNPRRLLLALTLGAACSAAWPCRAEEPPRQVEAARESFERGLALFERGEPRAALAELRRAHELAPSFRIFYNIALVNVALDDPAGAITAFQRYLREGATRVPAERRAEVEREIARLSQRAAALLIDVEAAGTPVVIDGAPVGESPLSARVWVNPGLHRVAAGEREQRVELAAGDERVLRFAQAASPAAEPASPAPRVPAATPEGRATPWLAWGVTGGLLAGSAVSGVVALNARASEQDLQAKDGVRGSELEAARSDVERWALVSDVLLAATALSAGVSLYLTLRADPDEPARAALVVTPGAVHARVQF